MAKSLDDEDKISCQENGRINCKSRRAVCAVMEQVEKEIKQIVCDNDIYIDSQEELQTKLTETFKQTFTACIQIDGQPFDATTTDENTTSEYESFDSEKERYINHDLMDQLDQQMVTTTQLRKCAPGDTRSQMKRLIRHQLRYLAQVTVKTSKEQAGVMDTDSGCASEQDLDKMLTVLQERGNEAQTVAEKCQSLLTKAQDLMEATRIRKKCEQSQLAAMFRSTPPTSPDPSGHTMTAFPETGLKISKKLNI